MYTVSILKYLILLGKKTTLKIKLLKGDREFDPLYKLHFRNKRTKLNLKAKGLKSKKYKQRIDLMLMESLILAKLDYAYHNPSSLAPRRIAFKDLQNY